MKLKNGYENVIFDLETAKTIPELVSSALTAKNSLGDLSEVKLSFDLSGAKLSEAGLSGAKLVVTKPKGEK